MDQLYRSAPFTRFYLGSGKMLVYFPLERRTRVLSSRVIDLLNVCSEFRTIADHASRLTRLMPNTQGCLAELTELARLGILICGRSVTDIAAGAAHLDESEETQISWIAIPTCDRTDQLRRAIESYCANAMQFDRNASVLICDDSFEPSRREANKHATLAACKDFRIDAFYAGREEKLNYIDALAENGEVPPDVLRFALFGPSYTAPTMGGNRNAILLHTIGSLALSVDDDTICKPGTAPGSVCNKFLKLGTHGEFGEFWFFADRSSALQSVNFCDVDVLGAHERYLGRSMGSVASTALLDGTLDFNTACAHLLQSLHSSRGQIKVTVNGVIGDSALHSEAIIRIYANKPTRRRLLHSEQSYRQAMTSREVIRQVLVPTISHPEPFIGTFIGLDNRDGLPPFFPAFRNEDGVFAQLLSRCVDQSYCAHLPWAMVHSPADSRIYRRGGGTSVRVSDIILAALVSWSGAQFRSRPSTRFASIGRHLFSLGSLPLEEFDEAVQVLLRNRAARTIEHYTSVLRRYEYGTSDYWGRDVAYQIRLLEQLVETKMYAMPTELLAQFAADEIPRVLQNLVRRFGELLCWWPVILDRAQVLANAGRHLGQPLS